MRSRAPAHLSACLVCLLVPVGHLGYAAFAAEDCLSAEFSTQGDMNECAAGAAQSADAELNDVYQEVLRRYENDPSFIAALREAQRAWIAYRDAEVTAVFPERDKQGAYGSVYPMCNSMLLERLTRERTNALRVWLDGVEEGDVCAGSVRIR